MNKTILNELYAEAKEQTLETLPEFLERVATTAGDWRDCDTDIHAVAISGVAASWAMVHVQGMGMSGASAQGGMWEYMINYGNAKLPAKLVEYEGMLYPQHAYRFETTLTSAAWAILQDKAKKMISDATITFAPEVRAHLHAIIDGNVPFGYIIRN